MQFVVGLLVVVARLSAGTDTNMPQKAIPFRIQHVATGHCMGNDRTIDNVLELWSCKSSGNRLWITTEYDDSGNFRFQSLSRACMPWMTEEKFRTSVYGRVGCRLSHICGNSYCRWWTMVDFNNGVGLLRNAKTHEYLIHSMVRADKFDITDDYSVAKELGEFRIVVDPDSVQPALDDNVPLPGQYFYIQSGGMFLANRKDKSEGLSTDTDMGDTAYWAVVYGKKDGRFALANKRDPCYIYSDGYCRMMGDYISVTQNLLNYDELGNFFWYLDSVGGDSHRLLNYKTGEVLARGVNPADPVRIVHRGLLEPTYEDWALDANDDYGVSRVQFHIEQGDISDEKVLALARKTVQNVGVHATDTQCATMSISQAVSKTSSFSRTHGVSLSVGTSFKVKVPGVGTSNSISVELSTSHEFTVGKEETAEEAVTFEAEVCARPGQVIVAILSATKSKLTVPYTVWMKNPSTDLEIAVGGGVWNGVTYYNAVVDYEVCPCEE